MAYSGEYVIVGPPGTGKTHRVRQSVDKVVREGKRPAVVSGKLCVFRPKKWPLGPPRAVFKSRLEAANLEKKYC